MALRNGKKYIENFCEWNVEWEWEVIECGNWILFSSHKKKKRIGLVCMSEHFMYDAQRWNMKNVWNWNWNFFLCWLVFNGDEAKSDGGKKNEQTLW